MTLALLLVASCAAAPGELTVEVWASWPGASVDELEAQVVVPLEKALARLPGGERATTEMVPGWSRTTLTLPAATTSQVNGALRAAPPPQNALVWVQARPAELSTWIVTGADEAALLRAVADVVEVGTQAWGQDKLWTTTDTTLVWTAEVSAPVDVAKLPRGSSLDDLLTADVGGRPLKAHLVGEPAPGHPDRRATWRDRPAAVLHVAGNGADLRGLLRERYPELEVLPWPKRGHRVELWGPDAEARATEVVTAARAAGAEQVGVVLGRGPLPGSSARRAEVFMVGDLLAELAGQPTRAWTPETARAFAEGGATAPPPGPEWDVSLDPDRLAQVGATAEEVAIQVRWMSAGVAVPVEGGVLRLRLGAPPATVQELASRTVTLPVGAIPLSSVAEVRLVDVPRYRRRP